MRELARRASPFGVIRVQERHSDGARLYCLGAGVQTMVQPGGVSLFGYVHAIKLMLRGARDILIIGGAGGSLATMLARNGHMVTVVDVDPAAEHLARAYFWLEPSVTWVTADAFDYLRTLSIQFDAVVVDACDGAGLIEPFAAPENLLAMMAAVRPIGSLVLNLVGEDGAPRWGFDLSGAIAASGYFTTLFRPEDGWEGNEILRVSAHDTLGALDLGDLHDRPAEARTYLLSLRAHPLAPAGRAAAR